MLNNTSCNVAWLKVANFVCFRFFLEQWGEGTWYCARHFCIPSLLITKGTEHVQQA